MATQLKIKKWLNDFLARRGLKSPDGRHLFSYHATPEEFLTLEEGLKQNMSLASMLGHPNPFSLWDNVPDFDALFVLYAALCWQQRYGGTTWTYDVILNSLNVSRQSHSDMSRIIERGLSFWGVARNTHGLAYLGAIAREAGLPQKLLSENRGAVGHILHSVLREAIRSGQSGSIITSWIESCKTLLPQSYRNEEVIGLLADSINAILTIKRNLRASTLDEAMVELEEKAPNWRSSFPLPLYDDTARDLLSRLLEDAATSTTTTRTGSPVSAVRSLIRQPGQDWDILARLDIPSRIETGLTQEKPRVLSMRIISGQRSFESVLKKFADSDSYFFQQKKDMTFAGSDATQEILVQYTTPSGFCQTHPCRGGIELDCELPWIFEGEEYGYLFRQQGGGSVRGRVCYVALAPGWEAEDAEAIGRLSDINRHVYRMTKSGHIKKGDLIFYIRTSELMGDECDWNRDNRFWDVEMLQPSLAFRGLPKPIVSTGGTKKNLHGEILQKTVGMENFVPLSTTSAAVGVTQVWFKSRNGASLRSHMLLLPERASIKISSDKKGNGILRLEGWEAETAYLSEEQSGLELDCCAHGNSLELAFKSLPNHTPPATVDICVSWRNNLQPARIRVPFPQIGARLFNAEGQEIHSNRQICVQHLHGLRLYCFALGVRDVALRLSHGGKKLDYPLEIHDGRTIIRLIDWYDAILGILSMTQGLDELVSLDILFDGKHVAHWTVARYESCLIPEETKVVLYLPGHGTRPPQGYALRALLLPHPELGAKQLEETLNEDGAPSGKWELSEVLDKPGPWLIYDDTDATSLRPLLWIVEGDSAESPRNQLQVAVAQTDKNVREQALFSCVAAMEEDGQGLNTPEWETLVSLFNHVKHLPLATLEIWRPLLCSSRIMAMIALHPGISFQDLTSRVDTELPFLWNLVSLQDWRYASERVKVYLEKLIPSDISLGIWQEYMQKTMEQLGAGCPSIHALIHVALSLPCEQQKLTQIRPHFTKETVKSFLFTDTNSEMQKLLRRHANDEWPTDFLHLVNRERQQDPTASFLAFSQGHRNSVLGLPVLLALQSLEPQRAFIARPLDPDTLFSIREHLHFDAEWFEQCSTYITFCCAPNP